MYDPENILDNYPVKSTYHLFRRMENSIYVFDFNDAIIQSMALEPFTKFFMFIQSLPEEKAIRKCDKYLHAFKTAAYCTCHGMHGSSPPPVSAITPWLLRSCLLKAMSDTHC